jgi:hypothetical protein
MKIKTIHAEVKLSKYYNTFTVGMDAEITEDEDEDEMVRFLQAKCRKLAKEQIELGL